jgi:NADH:ubiquinone oxidoreductase subunit H
MTWFTPEVIDVIIAVVKAIVILLAVVVAGALLSFVERRLLGCGRTVTVRTALARSACSSWLPTC